MELIARSGARVEKVRIERSAENAHTYVVTLGEKSYTVDAASIREGVRSLLVAGSQHEVVVRALEPGLYTVSTDRARHTVEIADPLADLAHQGATAAAGRGAGRVTAYMPGRVVAVLVAVGDHVPAGTSLMVLEAMKMQNEILAEREGTVRVIHVAEGAAVEGGDLLLELE